MEMFDKPKWLKPEINDPLYWLHLIIIAFIVLGSLQLLFGGDMLTWKNMFISVPLLGFADVIAHTVLGLD